MRRLWNLREDCHPMVHRRLCDIHTDCNVDVILAQSQRFKRNMGTYDTISKNCPKCGEEIYEQTKDFNCAMQWWNLEDPQSLPFHMLDEFKSYVAGMQFECWDCGCKFQHGSHQLINREELERKAAEICNMETIIIERDDTNE